MKSLEMAVVCTDTTWTNDELTTESVETCHFLYLTCCTERKAFVNLQIPHTVRDQLTKLMNSHPEFSGCAGTTAAFILQTCK